MTAVAGPTVRDFYGEETAAIFSALSDAEAGPGPCFRAHALPSLGVHLVSAVGELEPRRWAAHLLGGTFRGFLTDESLPRLEAVVQKIRAAGGHVRSWRTPGFGNSPESAGSRVASLNAAILGEFDPSGVLPGGWRP
jgi:hypothetical protein